MELSIIIVNFNVKHFLKQCLESVYDALKTVDGEVIVVDNDSTDGSREFIEPLFPELIWIQSKKNLGFGRANNQGLKIARGKYCLLLNPDTVIKADTLRKTIDFMDTHKDAGSLGIKMIDGSGKFLPESKRSFPTPEVAFYKLFGLAKMFPKNERFGQYHLTYLDKNKNHEVDVLSGAFLLIKTDLFRKIGGFDKEFFMYGEDIDLSYMVQNAGYKNYYFAESSILHYKGESTKSKDINYVMRFYQAMVIFARKHYLSRKKSLFIGIMNLAIWIRGFIAIISSFFKSFGLPILDALLSMLLIFISKELWVGIKDEIQDYPKFIYYINFPIYVIIGLIAMYFSGGYDRPFKLSSILRGGIYSILLISIAYAFFPELLRFSRAMIVFSGIAISLALIINRMAIQQYKHGSFSFYRSMKRNFIVLGDSSSIQIKETLLQESTFYSFLGLVTNQNIKHEEKIGGLHQLQQIIPQLRPTDIVVDTDAISYTKFVTLLEENNHNVKFHTTSNKGKTIISSHDSKLAGQIDEQHLRYKIALPSERRKKRLLDITVSIFFILISPLFIWIQKNKTQFIKDVFTVLFSAKTWVGYSNAENEELPKLKPSVLSTNGIKQQDFHTSAIENELNKRYAKNYSIYEDIDIILLNLRRL